MSRPLPAVRKDEGAVTVQERPAAGISAVHTQRSEGDSPVFANHVAQVGEACRQRLFTQVRLCELALNANRTRRVTNLLNAP